MLGWAMALTTMQENSVWGQILWGLSSQAVAWGACILVCTAWVPLPAALLPSHLPPPLHWGNCRWRLPSLGPFCLLLTSACPRPSHWERWKVTQALGDFYSPILNKMKINISEKKRRYLMNWHLTIA